MIECRGISSTSSSSNARCSSSKSRPSHSWSSAFKYLLRSSANVTRWTSRTGARTSLRDRQPEAPPDGVAAWPLTSHSLKQGTPITRHYFISRPSSQEDALRTELRPFCWPSFLSSLMITKIMEKLTVYTAMQRRQFIAHITKTVNLKERYYCCCTSLGDAKKIILFHLLF